MRDYVRDHSPAKDWDITTNALPEQVEDVFAGFHLIKTGLKHGTVTVVISHMPLEITTYRADGESFVSRHTDAVEPVRSLKDDLERRDFTMNALLYNPRTGIVDLVGGQSDIAKGIIRCVGNPEQRFQEDGLRILRALRFASVYGMKMEDTTAAAIHKNKGLLEGIAAERILVELTNILCGQGAGNILQDFADVLAVPIPELDPLFGFRQRNPHHNKDIWSHTIAVIENIGCEPLLRWSALLHDIGKPSCFSIGSDGIGHFFGHAEQSAILAVIENIGCEPLLRWSALLHDIGKPSCFSIGSDGIGHFFGHAEQSAILAGHILTRLCVDNTSKNRIVHLVRNHDVSIMANRKAVKHLLSKHGKDAAWQLMELRRADAIAQSSVCRHQIEVLDAAFSIANKLIQEEACFTLKDLAVNGYDMLALGISGAEIGSRLQDCLQAVLDERLPNEHDPLLSFICTKIKNN